jgi:hypothetical protein
MMVAVVMVSRGKSSWRGEHHEEQRCGKNFLHGPNRTTIEAPLEVTRIG